MRHLPEDYDSGKEVSPSLLKTFWYGYRGGGVVLSVVSKRCCTPGFALNLPSFVVHTSVGGRAQLSVGRLSCPAGRTAESKIARLMSYAIVGTNWSFTIMIRMHTCVFAVPDPRICVNLCHHGSYRSG